MLADTDTQDMVLVAVVWITAGIALLGVGLHFYSGYHNFLYQARDTVGFVITGAGALSLAGLTILAQTHKLRLLAPRWQVVRWIILLTVTASLVYGLASWMGVMRPGKVIKIGVLLPDNVDGGPILQAIQSALEEDGVKTGEYSLELAPLSYLDGQGVYQVSIAENQMKALLEDSAVAAIIGPYDSEIALKLIRLANGEYGGKKIALISPSVTADCMNHPSTISESCNNVNCPASPGAELCPEPGAFFRIPARNSEKARVLADCLLVTTDLRELCQPATDIFHKHTKVLIIHDDKIFSVDLAQQFRGFWESNPNGGIKDNVTVGVDEPQDGFEKLLAPYKPGEIDLVFFAGREKSAQRLLTAMQAKGKEFVERTSFASTGSIMNEAFASKLKELNYTGDVYAISPLKTVRTRTVLGAGGDASTTPYSAAGSDALQIVKQAIGKAVSFGKNPGGVPGDLSDTAAVQAFRDQVIKQIRKPDSGGYPPGYTGKAVEYKNFDQNGDILPNDFAAVYKWNNDKQGWQSSWDADAQGEVNKSLDKIRKDLETNMFRSRSPAL